MRPSLPFSNHMACINESISLNPSFLNCTMEIISDLSILKDCGEETTAADRKTLLSKGFAKSGIISALLCHLKT